MITAQVWLYVAVIAATPEASPATPTSTGS